MELARTFKLILILVGLFVPMLVAGYDGYVVNDQWRGWNNARCSTKFSGGQEPRSWLTNLRFFDVYNHVRVCHLTTNNADFVYAAMYDVTNTIPIFVAYSLSLLATVGGVRRTQNWRPMEVVDLTGPIGIFNQDAANTYSNAEPITGFRYDRGHLCADSIVLDAHGELYARATYTSPNQIPMQSNCNRDQWYRKVEAVIRTVRAAFVGRGLNNMYVVTGTYAPFLRYDGRAGAESLWTAICVPGQLKASVAVNPNKEGCGLADGDYTFNYGYRHFSAMVTGDETDFFPDGCNGAPSVTWDWILTQIGVTWN